MILWNQA